ncbi:MAG: ATP-binding cassette domain-containing protein [Holosporales bacterium]|jgi:polar amino acid transport system ATP-binding protein|nr:ATP-binding cassette domain-containing protein [Holosporales bacterium]
MIKIHQARKAFGRVQVLNGIDIEIAKQRIVGLVGPSGSGKSTLLRCIQGLERLDAGEISCDGPVGFIFQDFQLFPHMTVLQNITYAANIKNKDKDNEKLANELLARLGLTSKAHAYPEHLSGGQKQRVTLARSLMIHPNTLLCDEPTSGWDVATTSDVVTLLKSIQQKGMTLVIASHDLDFLAQIAERIILLKEGKIGADVTLNSSSAYVEHLKELCNST